MNAPLEGLRVIDFTRVLSGPTCTKALRDLGADVLKIEPPSGDLGRAAVPHVAGMSTYYAQFNAGKRNLCLDLNWPEARDIVKKLCATADAIVENFRPGTLSRFGLAYADVAATNPGVVYVSISGYGQTGAWKNRPAFAPTVHAETGHTNIVHDHFDGGLAKGRNDACSHADVYTGLQGVIAVLAALQHRSRTGEGQHVDVAMAATMLAVNERAGAMLSGIDVNDEPLALSANESPIFALPDGRSVTIAASPVFTPIFLRYCAMMRRSDLLKDPRFTNAGLRKRNLEQLYAEVRAWVLSFTDLDQLQAQVSESGLAVGQLRTIEEFADSEWTREWGAVVDVDDRAGGAFRMPGAPWHFSKSQLPPAGIPYFLGESNEEVLSQLGLSPSVIAELSQAGVLKKGSSATAMKVKVDAS